MHIRLVTILIFCAATFAATNIHAQDIDFVVADESEDLHHTEVGELDPSWQTDLSVSLTQRNSGYQIYTIEVGCENDDDCRSPRLFFTLPRQSRVNGVKFEDLPEATPYSIYGNASQRQASPTRAIDGYVRVDLPTMRRGAKGVVNISVELPKQPVKEDGASVMIIGNAPEVNKENNFTYLPLER